MLIEVDQNGLYRRSAPHAFWFDIKHVDEVRASLLRRQIQDSRLKNRESDHGENIEKGARAESGD
jgi:hypothetical protein